MTVALGDAAFSASARGFDAILGADRGTRREWSLTC
jgi:hypothetical protein